MTKATGFEASMEPDGGSISNEILDDLATLRILVLAVHADRVNLMLAMSPDTRLTGENAFGHFSAYRTSFTPHRISG